MKKVCVVVASVLMVACLTAKASKIEWYGGNVDTIDDPPGGAASTAGWVIGLFEDVDKDGIEMIGPGGMSSGDDVRLTDTVNGDLWADGSISWYVSNVDVDAGKEVFSVVFNETSWGDIDNDSMYIIIDGTAPLHDTFLVPNQGANDPNPDYNAGTGLTAEWQPVPEPTSLALMALGVAALVGRHIRRKK